MNAKTAEIINLIRSCELREARRQLRVYAKTNDAARKAVRRLNNLIFGAIDDVQRSISGIVSLLWHEELTGHEEDPRIASRYKGWFVASHGAKKGHVVHFGEAWNRSTYMKSKMQREEAVRWALEHRHENPHYDERASIAWLKANRFIHLVPMARMQRRVVA